MQTHQEITEKLGPYLTERRKHRIETVLHNRLNGIQLAIESPSNINNALAAVRSAEAMGILTIHLITPEGEAGSVRAVTQGAFHWVNIVYHDSLAAFLQHINNENLLLAGGALGKISTPLGNVPVDQPLCILMGNEQCGLSEHAKKACDLLFQIPLFGMSESFNLSVSAAISLYDATNRKRALLGQPGDLPDALMQATRAKYYLNSVEPRLADQLLAS